MSPRLATPVSAITSSILATRRLIKSESVRSGQFRPRQVWRFAPPSPAPLPTPGEKAPSLPPAPPGARGWNRGRERRSDRSVQDHGGARGGNLGSPEPERRPVVGGVDPLFQFRAPGF